MSEPLHVHVVYEHGTTDPRPYGSAHLRLLRPLTHPAIGAVTSSFGRDPPADAARVDCVVVDRLWRRDASPESAAAMVRRQQALGRVVVAAMDDDLLGVDAVAAGLSASAPEVAATLVRCSDGLLVTTSVLAQRYAGLCANVRVVANALDERLLTQRAPGPAHHALGPRPLVVGIMGTRTHDADLDVVRQAWAAIHSRRSDIRLEIVGAVRDEQPWAALGVRFVTPPAAETEYPLFMPWWSSEIDWDVGLAPLTDTGFNAAKSDIKALDLAAVGAAGIFSRVPAYEATVPDGERGLLVENTADAWAAAIERLADDPDLRITMARRAARDLWTGRILAHRAPDWAAALHALAERSRANIRSDTSSPAPSA